MKKIIMSLAFFAAAIATSYADIKIAVINPVKIFNDTNLGSVSVKKLENKLKPETSKLKQMQKDIVKKLEKLQQNSTTMTKNGLDKKRQQVQQEQQIFTRKARILQQKEYAKKDELSKKFQAAFDKSVQIIAKQKGYNIVVTTQALAYAKGIDDISDNVVAMMNGDSK